jgi:hypothetical protein
MVRTTGIQKISIMLVLSITILAAVLVTGTVVNIVSAANSVNVQTNKNQHPVTSTGSPHIVPESYKPHVVYVCPAGGSVKVPPKYQMACSQTPRSKVGLSQCYIVDVIDGDGAAPEPSPRDADCPAAFVPGVWVDIPPEKKGSSSEPNSHVVLLKGRLLGCTGIMSQSKIPPFRVDCGDVHGWNPIDNAAIEIKLYVGKDKHASYQPGVITKTKADGTIDGKFSFCDSSKYNDHIAYLTAYLNIPPADNHYIKGSKIPGPYDEPVSFGTVQFPLDVCLAHFSGITINADMSVVPTKFIYSGKLVDELGSPVSGVPVTMESRYLDGHTFTITQCPGGTYSYCPVTTKADGTFSSYFVSCDSSTTLKHDAVFNAYYGGGGGVRSPAWQFSTKPCSGAAPTHEKQNLLK